MSHFARRADQIKAFAAVNRLRQLTRAPAGDADRSVLIELATTLDEGRPAMEALRALRVAAAVEAVGHDRLRLDEDMMTQLLRLARHDDPARQLGLASGAPSGEIIAAARRASIQWRRFAVTTGHRFAGQRARDVLGVLEDIAAGQAAIPGCPGQLSATPIAATIIDLLLNSAVIPAGDRDALVALAESDHVAGQVGVPADARADVVAERAATLCARFRVLLHRPLPAAIRRSVTEVCEAFETIWVAMDSWESIATGSTDDAGCA
ncbi:MAG: hypothetical protein JXA67_01960 [Micromonosporaceae bacterium]|nr:hypothetical protein [Micromonosporaceae bacterium]